MQSQQLQKDIEEEQKLNNKNQNQFKDVVRQDIGNNQQGKEKMPFISYQWNKQYEENAKIIISQDIKQINAEDSIKSELYQKDVWDKFYKHHERKYFHPRNYLKREIPELNCTKDEKNRNTQYIFCEIGCGVGDTIFPLKDEYQNVKFYGFDLSSKAIECIKNCQQYDPNRVIVQQSDLVNDPIPQQFQAPDIVTLIFCLSAINPEHYIKIAQKIFNYMKPGAILYFRDYGKYDHQQVNLAKKGGRKLKENFYQKGDGIRVYYFSEQEISQIFQQVGFQQVECKAYLRYIENRKLQYEMYRVWIQARFKKPGNDIFQPCSTNSHDFQQCSTNNQDSQQINQNYNEDDENFYQQENQQLQQQQQQINEDSIQYQNQ